MVRCLVRQYTKEKENSDLKPHSRSARAALQRLRYPKLLMAAILDRDRDTASRVIDAPHLPAAARNVPGPATTLMRSPDGKSQRGDDGGKGIGSSGNDEEMEY